MTLSRPASFLGLALLLCGLAVLPTRAEAQLERETTALNKLCRNAMAGPDLEEALRICRRIRFDVGKLAPGSRSEVQSLVNLGDVQRLVSNQVDADAYYTAALALVDGGRNDAMALVLMNTLIEVKASRGKFLETELMLRRAIALQQKLKADPLDVARLGLRLADTQSQSHQFLLAEPLYGEIIEGLDAQAATLGAPAADLQAVAVKGLAETLERQQKLERAEVQYLRLLNTNNFGTPGARDAGLSKAQVLDRLGFITEQLGRSSDAIDHYDHELKLLRQMPADAASTRDTEIANLSAKLTTLRASTPTEAVSK